MGMKEIITVKASKVQVGDIICGTTWSKDEGTGINWVPSQTVVSVARNFDKRHQAHHTTWWLVTECMDSGYQDDLGPFFADSELHVVARSVGDALIGRGR